MKRWVSVSSLRKSGRSLPARKRRSLPGLSGRGAAYAVWCDSRELLAEMTGRLRHEARSTAEFPATRDWVAVAPRFAERRATIVAVLPRRTCLSRKAAGDTANIQVLAANVDIAFIVNALDGALLVLFYSGWLVING